MASFPEEIPGDDLIRAFTLTGADRDLVAIRRGAGNRLGLALQLCALRYLGFSMLRSRDLEELEAWLVERALEHDAPKVLFRLARERLRTERLVFPAPDRIVRLVSSARGRAQERTYTLVEPLLSAERRAQLDGLLEAKASNSWSTLKWLGQGASGESPGSIKSEVAKLAFLRQLGAHEWDLSDLNPNRRKFLAQVGRRSTSQTLQRMPDRRRYPILVVLLHETTLDLVDEIVDFFNRALQKTDSRSRRELEAWRVATAQVTNEKVRLFSCLGRLVLDPDIPDEQMRRRIFEEVASRELFAAAVEETEQLLRPRDGSYLDFVDLTYRQLAWTTDWYLREETLKAAFSALVDFQHQLPLAEAWGGGNLSSSDGQRFPVRGSAENATALPKYFGLGRGLTFYTWTSDQYSQYGSKVISSTVRDATYVLHEILDNQTDLPILEPRRTPLATPRSSSPCFIFWGCSSPRASGTWALSACIVSMLLRGKKGLRFC